MSVSEFLVRIECADKFAEVAVVDSRYKVRLRGIGTLQGLLPKGLYMARARSGDTTRQQPIRVVDTDVTVTFPEFGSLRSSAPLYPERGFETNFVSTGSASLVTPNANSSILLALRHVPIHGEESTTTDFVQVQSALGFELCTVEGKPIHDFSSTPLSPTASGHWVAALQIASGWYSLAIPTDRETRVLLPIYIGQRFSPSVFIELLSRRSGNPRMDLDRILVSYDDREADIFRDQDRMRAIELARRSLVRGRNMLTPALMQVLINQKFADPMLGLFIAHLMLASPDADQAMFEEVVRNTGDIMQYPEHPDLVIVRAMGRMRGLWKQATLPGDKEPLVAPPLLRASWDGLLHLKERGSEVVAAGSLLRTVASSLLRSSVWVLWRAMPATVLVSRISDSEAKIIEGAQVTDDDIPKIEVLQTGRRRKPKINADRLLGGLIDYVRAHPNAAVQISKRLASEMHEGTTLERTIARAALQLTQTERVRAVPLGYADKLASTLGVPSPMFEEGISNVFNTIVKSKDSLE